MSSSNGFERRPFTRRWRDAALVLLGGAVCAALLGTLRFAAPRQSREQQARMPPRQSEDSPVPCAAASQESLALKQSVPRTPAVRKGAGSPEDNASQDELERVRAEVDGLKGQRRQLKEELHAVERALKQRQSPQPYDFDLTQEQWKDLAAAGRLKYRMPCPMSAKSGWTIGAPILDELGLRPDDRQPIMDAFHRSNERVWALIQPMCAELLVDPVVVDLLGFDGCSVLIEKAEQKRDPMSTYDAQRAVAEVHAGMRRAPSGDEPVSKQQRIYSLLTSEGERFQADLAETFGPEDAERIWHSFPCTRTVQ